MHLLFNNLYAPVDSGTGASEEVQETFEFLNEPDEKEEVLDLNTDKKNDTKVPFEEDENDNKDEDTEDEVDDKEIDDELKEIEEELKGPSEEDLELTTPVRRREILKKYPQLFKDFPYLEKAYYREQQFTELLPTVQDAKIAVEKSKVLDNIERDVMSGDIGNVLAAAKQESPEAFLKIADNYLPALRKVDQQAYYHVLGNVVKDTIVTMVKEARNLGEQGQPLQAAANILNQFVFGSNTFTPPTQLSKQVNPEDEGRENQNKNEQRTRIQQQFESVKNELQTKADNVLMATIDQNIDPNDTMTAYIKRNAIKEAKETLEDLMGKDTRFRGLLDKLWEKAFQKGFDKESTDRIKSAYLSKAKTLLPSVVKKARNDALKGLGRKVNSNTDREEQTDKKGPIKSGNSTPLSSGSKIKKATDIPKGMSTLDVLNS